MNGLRTIEIGVYGKEFVFESIRIAHMLFGVVPLPVISMYVAYV